MTTLTPFKGQVYSFWLITSACTVKKTPAAKQCLIKAQTATSMEVHHVLKGGGGGPSGRTVISIPGMPSPTPKSKETLDSHGPPEKGTAKTPRFQQLRKQGIPLRSCKLRAWGSA